MEKIPKKHMGLLYVALAALFLFHPTVALVDVLPDAVGYLLLYIGVARLSDLSEPIADAAKRFRIMFFVGVGELLACYLTRVVMSERLNEMNRYEYPATIMLLTFVPVLFRLCFLIPAFRDFFKGLNTLADRFGADRLCTENQKGKSAIEVIQRKTMAFVILHSVFSMLPELAALTCYFDPNGEPSSLAYWYRFITLYRTVAVLLLLIVGIVWLISFIGFLRLVLRQNEWLEAIHSHYCKEVLTQTVMLRMRRVRLARLLICIGLPFTASLRMEGASVLPSGIFALFVLIALYPLGDLLPEQRRCRLGSWWLMIVSLLQQIANRTYLNHYYPEAALYQTDAFYHFLVVRVLSVAEAGLTVLLLFSLFERLFEVIKEHTEVNYGTKESLALSATATQRLHTELTKKMKTCAVLFSVCAVLNALDCFLQLRVFWIWPVALLLSVAAIWKFITFLQDLTLQIQYRYQADTGYKHE